MDSLRNGWFSEFSEMWKGQSMSLEVEEVLYHGRSKFQDVMILKSKTWGHVLVLDGVIQCTERDEFSYQEMISHLPVNSHPNPERVLVIGGGDGGVVRELQKFPQVKEIVLCEIDEDVITLSKKYIPCMAVGFDSPKLKVVIEDGFVYMRRNVGYFDIIITDSSDPVGPANSLFQDEYYQLMKSALRPGGIVCSQGECTWLHLPLIDNMQKFCRNIFPVVDYAYTCIPTYPCGQIGFLLCSTNAETNFKEPQKVLSDEEIETMELRYYNPNIHRASFHLPQFAHKVIRKQ